MNLLKILLEILLESFTNDPEKNNKKKLKIEKYLNKMATIMRNKL